MKILVFEYITGGGFAGQALPDKLAAEGRMMLQALLDDLKSLPDLELILPLDERCLNFSLPANARVAPVGTNVDINRLLSELMLEADAVWPVAPETGGVLADIARQVLACGKTLLLSTPETVAMCGDKLATYRYLRDQGLPVVEALPLLGLAESPFPASVIKPIDGVGCEGNRIIEDSTQFQMAIAGLRDTANYLIQPFCHGQAASLSCLFKQGLGWLLCCNQQQIAVENGQFHLQACIVNAATESIVAYQALVDRVARAMPGLWGYVGIDLIETPDEGALILEINPRLTTSYVGIKRATGINVAEQTLLLLDGEPNLTFSKRQPVAVVIH